MTTVKEIVTLVEFGVETRYIRKRVYQAINTIVSKYNDLGEYNEVPNHQRQQWIETRRNYKRKYNELISVCPTI